MIFFSDSGAMWRSPDMERFSHEANGIFSGTKGTPWEGGHRVPFIARCPGRIPTPSVTDALINHSHLSAPFVELLGGGTGNPKRKRGTTDEKANSSRISPPQTPKPEITCLPNIRRLSLFEN
ncbi:MAG: sulfatase-like hydrolase/transferase [Fuerstiella sp.]|nr:sulfatase-like hydrolase/transferase [Fuerstiella sp.]MCP4510389.1 sulfatase-like hydrolase/transferase [Fuerstiella sp.]